MDIESREVFEIITPQTGVLRLYDTKRRPCSADTVATGSGPNATTAAASTAATNPNMIKGTGNGTNVKRAAAAWRLVHESANAIQTNENSV